MLQLVDSEVVMLSAHWEKKRTSLNELQGQLQQLPALLQDLESLMASLGKCGLCVRAVSKPSKNSSILSYCFENNSAFLLLYRNVFISKIYH